MVHHLKSCLEDAPRDHIILHHTMNDLNSNDTSEGMTDKILNLAASVKTDKNQMFISDLVLRNNI